MAVPPKANRSARASRQGVLFGTDFLEQARDAALVAAAVARRMKAPLVLAHAIELPELSATEAKMVKWLTASRQKELRREVERLRKTGVKVEPRLAVGRPDKVLVSLSRAEASRLVVVASHGGRGAVDRWLLGSVAERAVADAGVPTLVVRDAVSLRKWVEEERPLKVFVCFNRTLTSEAALRWVKEWSAVGPCEVTVGCVNWPVEEWVRLGGAGPLPLNGNPPAVQNVLERDLRTRAEALLGHDRFQVRVEANWGRADTRLAEMAREAGADLIVTGSHQYRGFQRLWHTSISRGLLQQAPMNVVVVPLATGQSRVAAFAPPVRRVLVTTDFSEPADAAIPHAYSLLHGGGTVHLVHVVAQSGELPGRSRKPASPPLKATPETRHLEACAARLHHLVPPEAALRGILTQVEVIPGRDAAETICQHAERLGVDVICLGSHGRSGLSKALMGSVAQEVMARSRRPLLIIRPQMS